MIVVSKSALMKRQFAFEINEFRYGFHSKENNFFKKRRIIALCALAGNSERMGGYDDLFDLFERAERSSDE